MQNQDSVTALGESMSEEYIRKAALAEYKAALNYMNGKGALDAGGDPLSDPVRLEYYLFEYDPRYVREGAFRYCVKRRNDYLRSEGLPVPFPEDIFDEHMEELEI